MAESRLQSPDEPRYYSADSCSCSEMFETETVSGLEVSMAGGKSGKGLYDHLYRRFFEQRDTHEGYSFQEAPGGSAPTPVVTFSEKLRWWTWDRWQRRKKILAERDRLQRESLQIKKSENS